MTRTLAVLIGVLAVLGAAQAQQTPKKAPLPVFRGSGEPKTKYDHTHPDGRVCLYPTNGQEPPPAKDDAEAAGATDAGGARTGGGPQRAPMPPGKTSVDRNKPINYGVEPGKMHNAKGRGIFSGTESARRTFTSGDDTLLVKPHLTVIGTDSEREAVLNDLANSPELSGVKDYVDIQDYGPDDWPVKGMFPDGHPAIILQQPADESGKGRVLWRAEDYPGPTKLSEAIRKANPDYRPDADPGVGGAAVSRCPLGFTGQHWPAIILTAAVVIYLIRQSHRSR